MQRHCRPGAGRRSCGLGPHLHLTSHTCTDSGLAHQRGCSIAAHLSLPFRARGAARAPPFSLRYLRPWRHGAAVAGARVAQAAAPPPRVGAGPSTHRRRGEDVARPPLGPTPRVPRGSGHAQRWAASRSIRGRLLRSLGPPLGTRAPPGCWRGALGAAGHRARGAARASRRAGGGAAEDGGRWAGQPRQRSARRLAVRALPSLSLLRARRDLFSVWGSARGPGRRRSWQARRRGAEPGSRT